MFPDEQSIYFSKLFRKIGLKDKIENLDVDLIASSVNIERVNNNPRKLTNEDIKLLLMKMRG